MEIKYYIEFASEKDKEFIKKYKLASILDYAIELEESEKQKIINYVNQTIQNKISFYKMIKMDDKVMGCYAVEPYQDGVLLDEIYLEKEIRGQKIGSTILKEILDANDKVYLWVYKENKRAIRLYERLGFQTIQETETRLLMVHKNAK